MTLQDNDAIAQALQGADRPRWIELACHCALRGTDDHRAEAWLRRAHDALMTQAAQIGDPVIRTGYLQNVPHHREILAAFGRQDVTGVHSQARERAIVRPASVA